MSTIINAIAERPNELIGDDILYEVVDGQRVELPPMGTQEEGLANHLAKLIWFFLGPDHQGHLVIEMLFRLIPGSKLERRPDVAYVPFERWPRRTIPATDAWEVVPGLAVEVVSKNNTALEIQRKIAEYFQHGVLLVWVIYPAQRQIYVYDSPKSVRVLDANDTLDCGGVIPGLQLPVAKVFEVIA